MRTARSLVLAVASLSFLAGCAAPASTTPAPASPPCPAPAETPAAHAIATPAAAPAPAVAAEPKPSAPVLAPVVADDGTGAAAMSVDLLFVGGTWALRATLPGSEEAVVMLDIGPNLVAKRAVVQELALGSGKSAFLADGGALSEVGFVVVLDQLAHDKTKKVPKDAAKATIVGKASGRVTAVFDDPKTGRRGTLTGRFVDAPLKALP
jgi:hypothetical protein